ncbi:hypothetical protein Tco_0974817 [Tanacetum coccineum]|uniref:Uncharacterized protein n=1 Tax=Tanacetum coccineum TaxID=301880 RepID=A0ABQ5ECP1_9ASTR
MNLHGYGVLIFKSSWFLVKFRRRYAVSPLMDTAYSSEDSVAKQVYHKPHELVGSKSDSTVLDVCHQDMASEKHDFTGEGSGNVGFDHMLDSVCKDDLVDDKGEEGLVKLDNMLSMKKNILDGKLDEKVDAQVEVDRATGQESTPPTATVTPPNFGTQRNTTWGATSYHKVQVTENDSK